MAKMAFIVHPQSKDALQSLFEIPYAFQDELSLKYQPKVDFKTQEIIGYEALLRWENKDYGPVSPERILEIAAFYKATESVNQWIIQEASKTLRLYPNMHIAINMDPNDLTPRMGAFILDTLTQEGVSPEHFQIEITEHTKADHLDVLSHTASWLRKKGFTIALDDFGNGHSMTYLSNVDCDLVKIDRSYIQNIEKDASKRMVLSALINIVRICDVEILCEGIESEKQIPILEAMGIRYGQGYYLGKPLSLRELELLNTEEPETAQIIPFPSL